MSLSISFSQFVKHFYAFNMYVIHEGEIILKEQYGSSEHQRVYIKKETNNIVTVDEQNYHDVAGWFNKIFLPQGYPDSVSKDYIVYQVWDTAQAFCSTITGILATQEVLRGVGVGDTSVSPLAATITWVIKDGCGHIGRIIFAYSHGTHLDAYSKKWRLYADTLNDAAMCIEMALPLFKKYTTFALCVSTVMKAIVGVAGGATRAAMTQHHAIRGNLADVSAKDSAQETAVNLVASVTALLIITCFGKSLIIFSLMLVFHIIFNYLAVRAVCLRSLNEPRFLQLIDIYLNEEIISAPCEINRKEPIIFSYMGPNVLDITVSGFHIKLGCSMHDMISGSPKAAYWNSIKSVYEENSYLLHPDISARDMYVIIKENATNDDILCAYFHATLLSIVVCAINEAPLPVYKKCDNPRPFALICHTLQAAEWSRESTDMIDSYSGFTYNPSQDLLRYLDKIARMEWYRMRAGLKSAGWDLSKHLLIVEEWRVCNRNMDSIQPIPFDTSRQSETMMNEIKMAVSLPTIMAGIDEDEFLDQDRFTIEPDTSPEPTFTPIPATPKPVEPKVSILKMDAKPVVMDIQAGFEKTSAIKMTKKED